LIPARSEEVRRQLTFVRLERFDDAVSAALEPAKPSTPAALPTVGRDVMSAS